MDESRRLTLEITQEISDDKYLNTTEILSPKDLIGAKIVDLITNPRCDPNGDYDIISELYIRLLDGRVIIVTFAIDEGMLIEQWIPIVNKDDIK